MNKFDQYKKAESVVNSVQSVSQLDCMVKYIKLFQKQSKDKELIHYIRKQGLIVIDRLQKKAGLSDLITLRDYIEKV